MKRTSNHSEQRLFREELLSFTREICVCAHLTQTQDALEKCAEMEISVKNMPDSIFFASHIYMTLAILCRRRHKVAFYRRTESEIQFAISSAKECLRNGD